MPERPRTVRDLLRHPSCWGTVCGLLMIAPSVAATVAPGTFGTGLLRDLITRPAGDVPSFLPLLVALGCSAAGSVGAVTGTLILQIRAGLWARRAGVGVVRAVVVATLWFAAPAVVLGLAGDPRTSWAVAIAAIITGAVTAAVTGAAARVAPAAGG